MAPGIGAVPQSNTSKPTLQIPCSTAPAWLRTDKKKMFTIVSWTKSPAGYGVQGLRSNVACLLGLGSTRYIPNPGATLPQTQAIRNAPTWGSADYECLEPGRYVPASFKNSPHKLSKNLTLSAKSCRCSYHTSFPCGVGGRNDGCLGFR